MFWKKQKPPLRNGVIKIAHSIINYKEDWKTNETGTLLEKKGKRTAIWIGNGKHHCGIWKLDGFYFGDDRYLNERERNYLWLAVEKWFNNLIENNEFTRKS